MSLSFYGTTTPFTLTNIRPHGLAIRPKAGGRFGTPISPVIIGIEKLSFARIREFTGVHTFVADLIAVHAESKFCRVEIIHSKITFRHGLRCLDSSGLQNGPLDRCLCDLHFVSVTAKWLRRTNGRFGGC